MSNKTPILVIDDELDVLKLVEFLLWNTEYELIKASDAERGLQLVEETQPSVVIVDIMMPRMDGFTVLQRIREIKADLPVIIFTARSTRSDEKKAEELGANGFVAKPFNRQKLLTAIERAINPTGAAISETITEK
ncbi:MAG: response regulator [Chloroflexi bacterium]|nr:response regulator [Chloroflexota bacterium]